MRALPVLDLDSAVDRVAANQPGLWDVLRGARVFMTGGTGFFGTWLTETLLRANERYGLGASLCILSRRTLAPRPAIQAVQGDIANFTFPEGAFTHVIHAATSTIQPKTLAEGQALRQDIVRGMERTLEFARQSGARRFLHTSSGGVYGAQTASHQSEESEAKPLTAYGEGKLAAEVLGRRADLDFVNARCFAFVGPGLPLDAHYAIGNFMGNALRGEPIVIQGDGSPMRSYLYAADLAAWLWVLLLRGEAGRTYHVGSDEALDIAQVAHRVREVAGRLGLRTSVEILQPRREGPPARYVPAITRAREELGLAPWTPVNAAIERTLRWHL